MQSVVSLTSSLVVKMLNVLVSKIYLIHTYFFQPQKLLTFFSRLISIYAIFNGQTFNDMLTNDIVGFELGRDETEPPIIVIFRVLCFQRQIFFFFFFFTFTSLQLVISAMWWS